jgi:hypothetical protein
VLTLAEGIGGGCLAAEWIGRLIVLGSRAARFVRDHPERQLVVALSVPGREFAAALIGCGWVMASMGPVLPDPLETLRTIVPGTPVRAINGHQIINGRFWALNESASPPRVQIDGSTWPVDRFTALAVLPEIGAPERAPRPQPGSVGRWARLDHIWDARLAAPAADLAIVGTTAWLKDDFDALLGREGDDLDPAPIHDLLLPDTGELGTWSTRIYTSSHLAEHLPLPEDLRAVILDGSAAIRYIQCIESPAVFCVVDRSVADETAAEILVQLRNSRGESVSPPQDLNWLAPAGVEALAFTVPL